MSEMPLGCRTRPYEGSWAVFTSFKGQFNGGGEVRCPITEEKPFKFLGESRLEPATLGRCCDPMTVGRSRPAQSRRSWVLQVAGEEIYPPVEANQTLGSVFHVVPWAGQRLIWGPIFYNSHPSTTLHISLRWQVAKISTISSTDTPRERRGGIHDRVERPATPLTSRGYQGL